MKKRWNRLMSLMLCASMVFSSAAAVQAETMPGEETANISETSENENSEEVFSVTDETAPAQEEEMTEEAALSGTEEAAVEEEAKPSEEEAMPSLGEEEAEAESQEEEEEAFEAAEDCEHSYENGICSKCSQGDPSCTYEGSAAGYDGDITLAVTIYDGKVVKIDTVSQTETEGYWESATALFETIVAKGSAEGVDTISGATYSSKGILNAVKDAMSKAGASMTGSGTAKDPYKIQNADQLNSFAESVDNGTSYADQYVVLGADLDLSDIDNFNPIGTEDGATALFAGHFDGKGHTISHLTIAQTDLTAKAYYGLFSSLAATASVENVSLTDVNISVAGSAVIAAAGIAGSSAKANGTASDSNIGVRIDSCAVTGSVSAVSSGKALVYAAGLVGNAGIGCAVTNSYTNVDIHAESTGGTNSAYAGGLVGITGNYALIANCAAFGSCYANSPLSTNFGGMAGGLAAMLAGKEYNSYAIGDMTIGNGGSNHTWVGVLDGEVTTSGMTNGSYPDTGALRQSNYYASDASLTVIKSGESSPVDPTVDKGFTTATSPKTDTVMTSTAMTKEEMAKADFAETLNGNIKSIQNILSAYGIEGISLREWELSEDNRVVPTGDIWVDDEINTSIFAGGSGSKEDPYQIATAEQLKAFASSMNAKIDYSGQYVALTSDIDISGSEWTPIGGSDYAFNGSFDGAGHTISGLTVGSADAVKNLDEDSIFVGLFGVLGEKAYVSNVKLTGISIYTRIEGASAYVAAIAGYTEGAIVDGVTVEGLISHESTEGNQFVGGIIAYQYKGALINSCSSMNLSAVDEGGHLAEAGGLVALVNRALVANDISDSTIYASGCREDGKEGMAVAGNLVAVQAGSLVNCYASGNLTTKEYSTYAGMVSGWITGIGKSYHCIYNTDSTMIVGTNTLNPVESVGTKVVAGVNEDGDLYTGGLADGLTGANAASYDQIAAQLNSVYTAFPIDITAYGLSADALRSFGYTSEGKLALSDEKVTVTYAQPSCEVVPASAKEMKDGTWYGRDEAKTTVVQITVENKEITDTKVLTGDTEGDAYTEAREKAAYKAIYGDYSDYEAADPSRFDGGSGSKEDPYQIASAEQLQYLSASVNEDTDWEGVYFKQTKDIDLSDVDFKPIGWALNGEVKGKKTLIAMYPFCGNYDGGDYSIKNLTIGSADSKEDQMTSGLFGVTNGKLSDNKTAATEETAVSLKNIHLENVAIYVATRYETYTGGLVGNAQKGILIDNCSVTGVIDASTQDSFTRGGGLAGNALRGAITNSWANVDVTVTTDSSTAYGGGFIALTNRVTILNCYSQGDVTGQAGNNNKVSIGGMTGQAGGVQINCYASGDVISKTTTTDVGGINGRLAGIGVDYNCYFNSKARQQNGNTVNSENVANGVVVGSALAVTEGKTRSELAGDSFAALLNENTKNTAALLAQGGAVYDHLITDVAAAGFTAGIYADGSNLRSFKAASLGAVLVSDKETAAEEVSESVAALPAADSLTLEDEDAVLKAWEAYNALEDKSLCENGASIELAMAKIESLKAADTLAAAQKEKAEVAAEKSASDKALADAKAKVAAAQKLLKQAKVKEKNAALAQAFVKRTAKVSSLKGKKKAMIVKLAAVKTAGGYEIRYSRKANMSKAKTVKVTKLTKKITKLAKKKKYYVQVRAYKVIGGKKYYTAYSAVKSVKTR